jgi:hypothetical protein
MWFVTTSTIKYMPFAWTAADSATRSAALPKLELTALMFWAQ